MKNWARETFDQALQRLDLLIHREILRLRASYQLSLDEFRGLYISDQQVDGLILQHEALGQVDVSQLTDRAGAMSGPARRGLDRDPRWHRLCEVYRLSGFEQEVLLLAFVAELHSKYPILYAYLNNDITRKYPTVELALNLFSEPASERHRQAFSSQGALYNKGLIAPVDNPANHYSLQSGFVIAPTVREYLFGHPAIDLGITHACKLMPAGFRDWSEWPFRSEVLETFRGIAGTLRELREPPFFVVESRGGSGAAELVGNALADADFACCHVDVSQLLVDRNTAIESIRDLCQTALLEHAGLLIDDLSALQEPRGSGRTLLDLLFRQLRDATVLCFLLVPPKLGWRDMLVGSRYLLFHLDPPGVQERQVFWQHHLAARAIGAAAADTAAVADYFQLEYRQVQAASDELALRHASAGVGAAISREQLFAAARQQSHGDMGELADRVGTEFQMSDLVLPDAVMARIREVVSAIQSRRLVFEEWGLGRRIGGASSIVSLFAGASGTGKTMTASVIANEIGLDLYRIELSGIVSKYIGETEKNLDKIFAAAKKANCILFFDEADALFGKRSEVKDAHDRYANIEVAYLLQKIENHDGIVLLTTNLAKSIDQAFTRRVQFIIEFPRPDIVLREQLWRGMLTGGVPLADDVDFNFLARQLNNTGGDIKNMVLDAALMAAAGDNQVIDMALLVRAAARQMMKQGKVPSAVEFKHYFRLVDNRTA